ncbi:hypothetical protein [Variovorax boronicumulans]|uniref:hypothetical protein n=1 Tax=Variovorax boronicumulans TaxID=436515 RepID=UPI001C572649
MSNIYDAITKALSAHWKEHDNKHPQKLVVSTAQHGDLMRRRRMTKTEKEAAQVDAAVHGGWRSRSTMQRPAR